MTLVRLKLLDSLVNHPAKNLNNDLSQMMDYLLVKAHMIQIQQVGAPDWCVCGKCHPMSQEIENKCCKLKKCITLSSRFTKLCLDPDVLELCIKNSSDIRNDREDSSTRAFRKAAYRQFILARYGRLGKGNRRVCPSCVVTKIRERYPSITGIYMGNKEH